MQKRIWKEWYPGLDNDRMTLADVQETLPANKPEDISWIVRLFENPKSPIAFHGAIQLRQHDCIHILLGRGLLAQDEAFVIGYTMGTAPNITVLEKFLYKCVARYLYTKPYRMSKKDLIAYELGFAEGKASSFKAIYDVDFSSFGGVQLGSIRHQLGINTLRLRETYFKEKRRLRDTASSLRLLGPSII